jgi:hypothetical protein
MLNGGVFTAPPAPQPPQPQPTLQDLMAELQALQAKIEALAAGQN